MSLLQKLKQSNSNVFYAEAFEGAERNEFYSLVSKGKLEEWQDVISPNKDLIWRGKGYAPDRLSCHITGEYYDFKDCQSFKNYRLA